MHKKYPEGNGMCPDPSIGVDKEEVDPALGVIISFLKSSFVILWEGGTIIESGATGAANSWSPKKYFFKFYSWSLK